MLVWRMTEDIGRRIVTTGNRVGVQAAFPTPDNPKPAPVFLFTVAPDLGFVVGDYVTAIPTPWAGFVGGGTVSVYGTDAGGGLVYLGLAMEALAGDDDFTPETTWDLFRAGGAGDFRLGGGRGDFYQDQAEGVAQVVLTRLRLFRGEWFLDTDKGTPWYEAVLGVRTREKIQPALTAEILGAPGVRKILSFDMTVTERRVSIAVEADTIYGPVTIEGVL